MALPTTIEMLKTTRIAPGSYEAHVADVTTVDYAHGVYVRIFTNCDCGQCFPWVVTLSENAYGIAETERIEQIKTLKRAKEVAAILVHNIRTGK